MHATKVNTFVACIAPPNDPSAIGSYFDDALKALGLRSGAELAARLGVAPATFASWKSRGAVPQSHISWFTEVFVLQVFMAWRDRVPHSGDLPLACVIALLRRNDCNPFRTEADADVVTAHGLGGLTALASFLLGRQRELTAELDNVVAGVVASQLEECISLHGSSLLRLL